MAIYDDVTERRQAEDALKESEERIRNVLEAVQAGIVIIDPETHRIVDVNTLAARMINAPKDQIIGSVCHNYICPAEVGKCPISDLKQTIDRAERVLLSADGKKYSIIKTVVPVMIEGRRHLVESFVDITERKQAEEALRQSEEKYRTIIENMEEGYIEVDLAGRLTFFNEAAREIIGYSKDETTGMHYKKYADEENAQKLLKLYSQVYRTGIPQKLFEWEVIRKDGTRRTVEGSAYLIKDTEGRPVGFRGLFRDTTERKQAEEALRKSEEQYRSLAHTGDSIYIVDAEQRYLFMNEGHVKRFGMPLEGIVGRPYSDFHSKEDSEKFAQTIKMVFETGTSIQRDHTSERDGRFFIRTFSPVAGQSGEVRAVTVVAKDITARRQAEEALRNRENELRCIFRAAPIGIGMVIDRVFQEVNDSLCLMTGYSREELLGQSARMIYPTEEDFEYVGREKYRQIDENGSGAVETRWLCKNGNMIDILLSSTPLDPADLTKGVTFTALDITHRKQAQKALQKSEERYRLLAENANDIIYTLNIDGELTYISPSVSRILGFSVEEAMGRTAKEAFTPASFELAMRKLAEEMAIEGAGKYDPDRSIILQIEAFHKDGSVVPLEVHYSFIRGPEGRPVGILAIARDISEHKRTEERQKLLQERLQRAEKMEALGTLAGGVAHDLNNVLGVLLGYSELLLQNVPQESPFQRHAMQIFKGSQRAAAIIQDLLTLTRRGVVVSETLNLNRVISDFLQMPEFEAIKFHHPGVQFKTSLDAELLHIKGSSTHLNKTVMNLLSNAAESISGSGEVLIRTENRYVDRPIQGYDTTQEGEYVVLTVSDTGSGISPADLEKIFEPFYTKKVMGRSGTGLGLAVVWGTVKDHDGYIDVQSTEGKGSTFTLYFPVTREALTKLEQAIPRDTYLGRGEHILVVDDVEGQRLLASAMLDSLGYKVSTVASGEEAVEFLKEQPVDLLILDMIMDPGIDGLETYRRILEIRKGQKAIIVSGFAITERVRKTQELGAGPYVKKPYLLEKIGIAVRRELDK